MIAGIQISTLIEKSWEESFNLFFELKREFSLGACELHLETSLFEAAIGRCDKNAVEFVKNEVRPSIEKLGVHLPFMNLNPISIDGRISKASRDELRESINFAADLGADYVVYHARGSPDNASDEKNEISMWSDVVKELAIEATRRGVIFCLENADNIRKPGRILKILERCQGKAKLCLDIGHLYERIYPSSTLLRNLLIINDRLSFVPFIWKRGLPFEYEKRWYDIISLFKDYIYCIHIHNHDGKSAHKSLLNGKINLRPIQEFADVFQAVPVIIESDYRAVNPETVRQDLQYLNELIGKKVKTAPSRTRTISIDSLYRVSRLLSDRYFNFHYDHMFFPLSNLRNLQILNYILSRTEGLLRVRSPFSYPLALQLEPTIHCQLDCPLCPRLKANDNQEIGHMEWDNYHRLMREIGPYLLAIAFWQWGEPLLHPRIVDMIRLAKDYGIFTVISTNGQINPDTFDFEALVESGLDMIIISMDGATQEVFEKFRAGGDLKKIQRFTEAMVKTKNLLAKQKPLVNVRIVAIRDNENDIEDVRNYARAAGANVFTIKSVSLYDDSNPLNQELPENIEYRSFQYQGIDQARKYRRIPNLCTKPWSWPTLRFDGTLLMCECDHCMDYVVGNVFSEASFKKVWRCGKAQEIRGQFPFSGCIGLEYCNRCRYKIDDAIREVQYFDNV